MSIYGLSSASGSRHREDTLKMEIIMIYDVTHRDYGGITR